MTIFPMPKISPSRPPIQSPNSRLLKSAQGNINYVAVAGTFTTANIIPAKAKAIGVSQFIGIIREVFPGCTDPYCTDNYIVEFTLQTKGEVIKTATYNEILKANILFINTGSSLYFNLMMAGYYGSAGNDTKKFVSIDFNESEAMEVYLREKKARIEEKLIALGRGN